MEYIAYESSGSKLKWLSLCPSLKKSNKQPNLVVMQISVVGISPINGLLAIRALKNLFALQQKKIDIRAWVRLFCWANIRAAANFTIVSPNCTEEYLPEPHHNAIQADGRQLYQIPGSPICETLDPREYKTKYNEDLRLFALTIHQYQRPLSYFAWFAMRNSEPLFHIFYYISNICISLYTSIWIYWRTIHNIVLSPSNSKFNGAVASLKLPIFLLTVR